MTRLLLPALAALLAVAVRPAAAQTVPALLVPDSINDRILRLDPATGDVVDGAFIQDSRFGTVIQAIGGFDGQGILVSDQVADVVWEFTSAGEFVGVFAPAGGADPAVLDNIRGIAISPDGQRLLVTVAGGGNANSVVAFNRAGALVGTLVAAGAGGLDSPWSVLVRADDVLVGASGPGAVLRYTSTGTSLGNFATGLNFPQQMIATAAGGVLVANFSPAATRGYYEYGAAGQLIRTVQLGALEGAPRGIAELPGGTLLAATSAGIYDVSRDGAVLSTKITGGQYRFISPARVSPTTSAEAPAAAAGLAFVSVGPTPARRLVAVRLRLPEAAAVRVDLVDALGRRVAVLHDAPAAGVLALSADVAGLAPGVYGLRARTAAGEAVARVVVAR